ncbi:MAG: hypothetical protein HY608_07075, partial [Planctomycetes bacterium]|nr:hypothetical protein [Planctomycetota bacterium]
MRKAPYQVAYHARCGEEPFARYSRDGSWIEFALAGGRRTEGRLRDPEPDGTQHRMRYANAVGPGLDLELTTRMRSWSKDVVIRSMEGIRGDALEVDFPFRLSGDLDVVIEGVVWDREHPVTTHGSVLFRDRKSGSIRFQALPPEAMCDTPVPRFAAPVSLTFHHRWNGRENTLVMTKRIETAWIRPDLLPVRADVTLTATPPTSDGKTTKESSSDSYETTRSAAAGDTSSTASVQVGQA